MSDSYPEAVFKAVLEVAAESMSGFASEVVLDLYPEAV